MPPSGVSTRRCGEVMYVSPPSGPLATGHRAERLTCTLMLASRVGRSSARPTGLLATSTTIWLLRTSTVARPIWEEISRGSSVTQWLKSARDFSRPSDDTAAICVRYPSRRLRSAPPPRWSPRPRGGRRVPSMRPRTRGAVRAEVVGIRDEFLGAGGTVQVFMRGDLQIRVMASTSSSGSWSADSWRPANTTRRVRPARRRTAVRVPGAQTIRRRRRGGRTNAQRRAAPAGYALNSFGSSGSAVNIGHVAADPPENKVPKFTKQRFPGLRGRAPAASTAAPSESWRRDVAGCARRDARRSWVRCRGGRRSHGG